MHVTFLGTGTSHGVPMIDCMIEGYSRCPKNVCRLANEDPRHARTRCSLLVKWSNYSVLIDVSADFREQILREKITKIDAVLMTHGHADHIGGIPDIRSFTKRNPLPIYGSSETIQIIKNSFSYIFDPSTFVGGGVPQLVPEVINGPFSLFGKQIVPISVTHGGLTECLGFRIGPLAYIPDMKAIDTENRYLLEGTEVLILNCLRDTREHSTHLILPDSVKLSRQIGARMTYFIHMSHDIHYQIDSRELDPGMSFAYDGLSIEIAE